MLEGVAPPPRGEPITALEQEHALSKSVTVLGKSLSLKDSQGVPGQRFIAEYIPSGETFDNWTLMFATRFVTGTQVDPTASAKAIFNRILVRKQTGDLLANAAVFKPPDGKSVVVDFLLSEGKIVEHDVWRYFKTGKGMVSLQIARRVYRNQSNEQEVRDFIKSIQTQRNIILQEIMRPDLPVGDAAK